MFRGTPDISDPTLRVETTDAKALKSVSGNEGTTIIPKSAVNGIAGFQIYLTATVTGTPSGKVGDILKKFKIRHGANTQLEVSSFDQLNKVYHMLTGLTLTDVNITGAGTFTLKTPYIPFGLGLDAPNYFDFKFNAPSSVNADSLDVSVYMIMYYAPAETDHIVILNPGVDLNADTDIDLFDYVSENKIIKEMWIDITADTNLNYMKFKIGHKDVLDSLKAYDLQKLEAPVVYTHIDGFFKAPVPFGTKSQASGSSNENIPKLLINLANSVAPTIYLHIQ